MGRCLVFRLVIFPVLLCTVLWLAEVIRMLAMRSSFDGEEMVGTFMPGSLRIIAEKLYLYQGFDPSNANVSDDNLPQTIMASEVINQREADLLFMWKMYEQLDDNSKKKTEILEEITATTKHRLHLDSSVDFIGKLLFGSTAGPSILGNIRSSGQPLVDDWDCLKSMVRVFESHCGSLTHYGMKHMRAFANICNKEISMEAMEGACISACGGYYSTKWDPLIHGYSA